MSAGSIFTVESDGALTRMTPSAPGSELEMQELVAQYPELIADSSEELLLIRREQPIADSDEANGRWSLDHLFVTKNAIPVLVELKRATDTRIRREVVGQMLDYAANATAYWRAGTVAIAYSTTADELGFDSESDLVKFLDGQEPDSFWDQVDSNFRAGKVKLVFVADTIPRELARIVEYLNEHLDIDVRAIELNWFTSNDGRTSLAPKVIGRTDRAESAKASSGKLDPISREDWIRRDLLPFGQDVVDVAKELAEFVEDRGGNASVASTQGSIVIEFEDNKGRKFYPINIGRSAKGRIYLNLGYLQKTKAFADERARKIIYDQLNEMIGPLSTDTLNGAPGFPIAILSDEQLMTSFKEYLNKLVATCRQ